MNTFKLKAGGGGGTFTPAPEGTHGGTIAAVIDLGTQPTEFGGEVSERPEIFVAYELADTDGDDPVYVGRSYRASLHEKSALFSVVSACLGRPDAGDEVDIADLAGKACLVEVEHATSAGGNVYARVRGVIAFPRKQTPPRPTRTPLVWQLADGEPPPDAAWLPFVAGKPVAEIIARAKEWCGREAGGRAGHPDDDEADEAPVRRGRPRRHVEEG
jgi:hypothetical protein